MAMQTLEYNYEDFEKPRAGDDKLAIRFFRKARQDPVQSAAQGRPIFEECDYIQIMVAGDRNSTIVRPVGPNDKTRFGQQYDHWQKTQTNIEAAGTPLEAWGKMSLSQIEEYRYFGIRTVDQLADLRDDICQKIMGATLLKQAATAFLAMVKEEAPMKKMMAELEERDKQIAALNNALAEQGEALKQLQAKRRTA